MKGILRQHPVRTAIIVPFLVLVIYSLKNAFEIGTSSTGNAWIALGSIVGGFLIEAVYVIGKELHDCKK